MKGIGITAYFFLLTMVNSVILPVSSKPIIFATSGVILFSLVYQRLRAGVHRPTQVIWLLGILTGITSLLMGKYLLFIILIFGLILNDNDKESFNSLGIWVFWFIVVVLISEQFGFTTFKVFEAGEEGSFRSSRVSLVFRNPNVIYIYLTSIMLIFYNVNRTYFWATLLLFAFCQYKSLSFSSLTSIILAFFMSTVGMKFRSYIFRIALAISLILPFIISLYYDIININIGMIDLNTLTSFRLILIKDAFLMMKSEFWIRFLLGFTFDNIDHTWIYFVSSGCATLLLLFVFILSRKIRKEHFFIYLAVLILGTFENLLGASLPLLVYTIHLLKSSPRDKTYVSN